MKIEEDVVTLDVVGDWYAKLVEARQMQSHYKAVEDEAKEIIKTHLGDKHFGTIDGKLALELKMVPRRATIGYKSFPPLSAEIGARVSKMVWKILSDLGVKTTLPAGTVAPAITATVQEVLDSVTPEKLSAQIDTSRFVKASQQS